MYEFDWANKALWARETSVGHVTSSMSHDRVAETLLLHWQEHCVECAPPHCYTTCPLYVVRGDHRCARFVYGVFRNPAFEGLLDGGADVRFRRWGKIETRLFGSRASVRRHRLLDRLDAVVTRGVFAVSRALQPAAGRQRLTATWAKLRESLLSRGGKDTGPFDDFVLECYVPGEDGLRLILERSQGDLVLLRHVFELNPGHNFQTLPATMFGSLRGGRIRLYPDEDAEARVIFMWLDFVKYARLESRPAGTTKVVVWDLDNTLWTGTLLEDGEEACHLREGVQALVEALDARGILQSIVSKNDHDQAWSLVEKFGLQDYFLYPAINWGQKSANLRQIAEALNVGLDSFAVIDDSPFERAEIRSALPMVRVYDVKDMDTLLSRPEFDVPITEMSRKRRLSYLAEANRGRAFEQFDGDYRRFLRSCNLRVRVFLPKLQAQATRCLELVQRSNQLNLSARRYTDAEFAALLATPGVLSIALEAEDRFGDYGIVGFASIDERSEVPFVRDFVVSCRIAGKHVEQSFFQWLATHESARGATTLRAQLVRTPRNRPLVRVIEELPFESARRSNGDEMLEMRLDDVVVDDVVTLSSAI
jgi:FkbH-like protein